MRVAFWGINVHIWIARAQIHLALDGAPTAVRLFMGGATVLWLAAVLILVRLSRRVIQGLRSAWNDLRPLAWSWTTLTMLTHGVGWSSTLEDLIDVMMVLGIGVLVAAPLLASAWVQVVVR